MESVYKLNFKCTTETESRTAQVWLIKYAAQVGRLENWSAESYQGMCVNKWTLTCKLKQVRHLSRQFISCRICNRPEDHNGSQEPSYNEKKTALL